MANTALNRSGVAILTNKSGSSVAYGGVVILDSTTAESFTTTTTANYEDDLVGVVLEPNGIANNASGLVAVSGFVPKVTLAGSASLGDYLYTHTVAGQAQRSGTKSAGAFGQVLGTGTSPKAILFGGLPKQTATGSSGTLTSVGAYASARPGTPATGDRYIVTDGYWNEEVYDGSAWRPMMNGLLLNTPSSSGWSWDNQGSATIDSALGGLYLYVPAGTSSISMRARYRTAPAAPYTITALIRPNILGSSNGYFGFGWRQSSDGKLACALVEQTPATATPTIYSAKFSAATTYVAAYTSTKILASHYWLRIADNNTNRIISVSVDGRNWLTLHSVSRTDQLTADQVFFGVAPSSTTLDAAATLLSWREA